MSDARRDGAAARFIKTATKIESNELTATLLSFTFVFVLMTAYFILRPVRDSLSSDWTDEQLSWLGQKGAKGGKMRKDVKGGGRGDWQKGKGPRARATATALRSSATWLRSCACGVIRWGTSGRTVLS